MTRSWGSARSTSGRAAVPSTTLQRAAIEPGDGAGCVADAAAHAAGRQLEQLLDDRGVGALPERGVEIDHRDLADPAVTPGERTRIAGIERLGLAADQLDRLAALQVDRGDDHGRTCTPSAASARLTSATVMSSSWKIEAASTASAPASNASFRCCRRGGAARGDHRHPHRRCDRAGELQVVARARAVPVPAGEQDLARAAPGAVLRPLDRIDAGALAAALDEHLETAVASSGIDREHRALAAEAQGDLGEQLRSMHGGRIDRDLVCPGLEQGAGIVDRADAAADRERNAEARAHALHRLDLVAAALGRRRDVQDHDLVRALALVQGGALRRIAGIAQALEAHALDHAAVADVETGDDPGGQHRASSQRAISR